MLAAGLVLASLLAAGSDAPSTCGKDQVVWNGRCFSRYEWEPDDPSCPDGVIVIPDGQSAPRCVPCEAYDGMQQPMNYCAGLRATKAEEKMKATFDDLVKRLPAREGELRKAQRDWVKRRDAACRRAGQQYEGGSLQPQVESECLLERTRKRSAELARMGPAPSGAAPPPSAAASAPTSARCGGDPAGQVAVDRRASLIADKSHFQDEPKACLAGEKCPWRRRAYVVRGDVVTETAVSHGFACVTYKATTGWLPLADLCEAGSACAAR